jgi:urate oxidase
VRYAISYGKAGVPVYRAGADESLFALEVDVEVFGHNFLPAYTDGDNENVVATDSMKNAVLRHGQEHEGSTLEGFLDTLGRSLLGRYHQMESLRLAARELRFDHLRGVLHARSHDDHGVAEIRLDRGGGAPRVTDVRSGRVDLRLLKVTGSAFTRFVRDEYTTLPERRDRPLFIRLDCHWRYADPADALARHGARYVASTAVKDLLADVFDGFVSESIQQLVHVMGTRVLERFPQLSEVSFLAENRTRDPLDEERGPGERRAFTDPFPAYGTITLTLTRDGSWAA